METKTYSPHRVVNLINRASKSFSLLTERTVIGHSHIQPSPQELVYMYNVLGEMVNGLLDMEPKETIIEKQTDFIIGMYLVNGQCPRCKNNEIKLDHKFCKICGMPIVRDGEI